MSEFNQAEFAAKVALDSFDRAASLVASSVDAARQKISVAMRAGFRKYRENSRERYGYVRTLLHRDKPIPLRELYVPTDYRHDDELYSDDQVLEKIMNPCRILIQGTAGGGKSIFLRYINLVVSTADADVLPLFFEMKSLNGETPKTLVGALADLIKTYLSDVDEKAFLDLLDDGRIILILDGFDEINFEDRPEYVRQLAELSRKHPNAKIVASSRPDDTIESVESFHTFRVVPFKKGQTLELLKKLPYDRVVKSRFMEEVEKELYDKHEDFLSNPLLISMMLMTYQQFAEIPNKIHIFYQQAFYTLFSLHDSSKEVYKRKSYTDLPIDEFQRVFACFCALTYAKQAFTFTPTVVREYLREAINTEMISSSPEDLLRDLMESTCLLQKDGIDIVFAHRSFQEYFTAWYIVRMESRDAKRAMDAVVKRVESDLVLPMAFEMNPALVEKAWVLPTVDALIKKVGEVQKEQNPFTFLALFFELMYFPANRPWMIYALPRLWPNRLRALHKLYGRSYPELPVAKFERGWSAFVARLQDKAAPPLENTGLSHTAISRLIAGQDRSRVAFHFAGMAPEMVKFIDVTPWTAAITEWLPNIRAVVFKRVGERDRSQHSMFRGRA